jgi:hypothetical protein
VLVGVKVLGAVGVGVDVKVAVGDAVAVLVFVGVMLVVDFGAAMQAIVEKLAPQAETVSAVTTAMLSPPMAWP